MSSSCTDDGSDIHTEAIEYIQKNLTNTTISISSHFLELPQSGVRLHYIKAGPALAQARGVLLFVHGWPDFWFGWRHQLAFFSARGYLCFAVDQRGFGSSRLIDFKTKPISPEDYTWQLASLDLKLMLDHEQVKRMVILGHDWGGATTWSFVRRYPSYCHGVVSLCTPYRPAKSTFISTEQVANIMPVFFYQVHFKNRRKEAAKELEEDTPRTISCLFRTGEKKDQVGGFMTAKQDRFLSNFPVQPRPSKLMTDQERSLYVRMFQHSGWETGLCWYGTARANYDQETWNWRDEVFDVRSPEWQKANCGSNPPPDNLIRRLPVRIATPALMITAGNDYVLRPSMTVGMEAWCDSLKRLHVEGVAHWLQMEQPQQVNEGILAFLEGLPKFVNEPVQPPASNNPSLPTSRSPRGRAAGNSNPKSKL